MKMKYCTISGADEKVAPERLAEMTAKYPFVEWAILYSPQNEGMAHYPRAGWLQAFHEVCAHANKSIHLCHQSLNWFAEGSPLVMDRISRFQRVQLNLGFEFDISTINREGLVAQVKAHPLQEFIFQYNFNTMELLHLFDGIPNVSVLFDASAGTGTKPKTWPMPRVGRFCGYAGGIGPDNVTTILYELLQTIPNARSMWIDMESGVRTKNEFDLAKVETVLEAVSRGGDEMRIGHRSLRLSMGCPRG